MDLTHRGQRPWCPDCGAEFKERQQVRETPMAYRTRMIVYLCLMLFTAGVWAGVWWLIKWGFFQ